MFKLVVLCALVALTAASGIAPLAYSAAVIAPYSTTISRQASSVIHPSPLVYSSPLLQAAPLGYSHLIAKRSAPLAYSSYIAPVPYYARAPLVTTYAAPLTTTYSAVAPLTTAIASPVYGAHLIKKRSAPLFYSTPYLAPTTYASAPLVTPTYAAAPLLRTPLISTAPIAYSHLIKKRSAPLLAAYAAPAAISTQSRFDIKSTPAIATYTSYAPLAYSSPIFSHVY